VATVGSHRLDDPGELETRNVRRGVGWSGIASATLQQVCAVDPEGVDPDPDLTAPRLGAWP